MTRRPVIDGVVATPPAGADGRQVEALTPRPERFVRPGRLRVVGVVAAPERRTTRRRGRAAEGGGDAAARGRGTSPRPGPGARRVEWRAAYALRPPPKLADYLGTDAVRTALTLAPAR